MKTNKTDHDFKLGLIAYTDGGAKPNPGFAGCGIHAFTYLTNDAVKPIIVNNFYITNFGYVKVDKISNIKNNLIYLEPLDYHDVIVSLGFGFSNNYCELLAVKEVLKLNKDHEFKDMTIFTDSTYAKDVTSKWMFGWVKNGWMTTSGKKIENLDLIKEIYELVTELKKSGVKISVRWTPAHIGNLGNEKADMLASIGVKRSSNNDIKTESNKSTVKKYWDNVANRNPMFNLNVLWFNAKKEFNEDVYYFSDDISAGRYVSDSVFSVINLNELDRDISIIKEEQYKVSKDKDILTVLKLDKLYSKEIYPSFVNFGLDILINKENNINLTFVGRESVTEEISPTGLAFRAIDTFLLLKEMKDIFINFLKDGDNTLINKRLINYLDITDHLFDSIEKKNSSKQVTIRKVLKSTITTAISELPIDIDITCKDVVYKTNIKIVFGLDIINRNNLKKLEDFNPEVYLVTWLDSDKSAKYATVIKTDLGNGLWNNVHSCKVFLK